MDHGMKRKLGLDLRGDKTAMPGMDLRTGAPMDSDMGEKPDADLPDDSLSHEAKVEAIRQVLKDLEDSVSEITVSDARRRKAGGAGHDEG